jgi:hypothetical protein
MLDGSIVVSKQLVPSSHNRQAAIKPSIEHSLIMLIKKRLWIQKSHCMLLPNPS